jgi:hypothetical protein
LEIVEDNGRFSVWPKHVNNCFNFFEGGILCGEK